MIEIDVDADPHTAVRAAKMTRGVQVTFQAEGQRIVLHLDDDAAHVLHAQVALALARECAPNYTLARTA